MLPPRDPGTVIRNSKPHTVSFAFDGDAYFGLRMIKKLNRIGEEIFEHLPEISDMACDHGPISLHMHPDVFGLKAPAQLLDHILKRHSRIDRLYRGERGTYPGQFKNTLNPLSQFLSVFLNQSEPTQSSSVESIPI